MKKLYILFSFLFFTFNSYANNGFLEGLQTPSSKNNKTLLIFYREDCPYCNNMDKIISADANFQKKLLEKYNVKVLDIKSEEGRMLADKFNIHAVPTLVNFDNTTGESKVIKGFAGIEKLSNLLELTSKKSLSIIKEETLAKIDISKASENAFGVCGNGIVEAGENCDDGNLTNGDGCSSTCTVQVGFSCTGNPSVCFTVCGDGVVAVGIEQCDDGNITNGDGCTSTCTVQVGFSCVGTPSVCTSTCGDGIVAAGFEQCDDGNATNGDGCNSSCSIEPGFTCTGNPSVCAVICGDGIVGPGEQCDDGNNTNGDGCNNTCQYEVPVNNECSGAINLSGTSGTQSGYNTAATNSIGAPVPSCQSNINKDVWYSFTLAAPKLCRFEVNGPTIADPVLVIYAGTCGTLTQVGCDDDAGPGTNSLLQLSLNAGNYFIRIGSFNTTTTGTFSLVYNFNLTNICGNTIIESSEECDDGNTTSGDGCSNICKIENATTIKGVAINRDSTRADPSAMLDVKSFDRGILIPRMNTAQRTAIASPAKGLLVFDITTNTFWYNNGTVWTEVGGTSGAAGSGLPSGTNGQTLRNNGTSWIANSALQNDGTNVTVPGRLVVTGGIPGVNKVFTSDATGIGSWQLPAAGSIAFSLNADSNRTLIHSAADIRLHFGNYGTTVGNFNIGNAFNSATDEFVAPSAGLYSFTMDIYVNPLAATNVSTISQFKVDNASNITISQQAYVDVIPLGTLLSSNSHTAIFNLSAGDKVYVLSGKFNGGGTSNVVVNYGLGGIVSTKFSGYKIN